MAALIEFILCCLLQEIMMTEGVAMRTTEQRQAVSITCKSYVELDHLNSDSNYDVGNYDERRGGYDDRRGGSYGDHGELALLELALLA